jgi:NAD(P)-dependent dehydrogenase (short-subunit alcohol dehydrogenase family)
VEASRAIARTALVTGANRGIGLEAARRLARAGLDVVATARDRDAGEAAAAELGVRFEQLDVSRDESVRDCAQRLAREKIAVDVLVNNAGVLISGAVLEMGDDLLRDTLEVNLLGPLRTARAFMPGMIERGYGRVVNVSSGAGSLTEATPYSPAYSISKAALNMLTRHLAFAAEGHGDVKVNAMCPGWVRTDMGGQAAPRSPAEAVDTLVWLATLPPEGPTNGFFRDRAPAAW